MFDKFLASNFWQATTGATTELTDAEVAAVIATFGVFFTFIAIIPIYNIYVLLKIVGRPGWWLLLFLIPIVNIVFLVILAIDVAKAYGKDAVFGIFLNFFLNPIGSLILGFGSSKYLGPVASENFTPSTPAQAS